MRLIYCLLALTFALPEVALSQGRTEKSDITKKESESNGRRRQKVMMCHECGKPETQCDCEGEGHGVENNQSEDHHHSKEK